MSHAGKNGKSKDDKGRKSKSGGKVAFGDFHFANVELTAEHKSDFRESDFLGDVTVSDMDYLLTEGHSVRFSLDSNGGGILCSASHADSQHPNGGFILTGRGSDARTALAVLLYKDSVVCGALGWEGYSNQLTDIADDIG